MSIVSSLLTRIKKIIFFIYKTPILQVSLAIILGSVFGLTVSLVFWAVLLIIIVLGKRIPFLKFSKFLFGFLFGLFLISIRLFLVRDELPNNHVSNFNGSNISIIGVVTSDSRMKSDAFSAVIKAKEVCSGDINLLSEKIRTDSDTRVEEPINEIRIDSDTLLEEPVNSIRTNSDTIVEEPINSIRINSDTRVEEPINEMWTDSDTRVEEPKNVIRTNSDIRTSEFSIPIKTPVNQQKDSDIIRTHSDTEDKIIKVFTTEINSVESDSKKSNRMRSIVTNNFQMNLDKNINTSKQSEDPAEYCISVQGKVQTWSPRYPKLLVGDVIRFKGDLNEPEDFENSDKFSYKNYLKSKGIHSLMYRPEIEYSKQRQIFFLYDWLVKFQELLFNKINRSLPEPHASLLCGILFGAQRNMPEDFADSLRVTGTTHVIAASGYNVTLVINGIIGFLSFMHRRRRIVLAIIFVWIFVIFSGASLPVIRAGIMGSITLAAMLTGNESDVHVALPLSAAIMVMFDPSVIKSISFQLSFVSTVGLVYFVPVLEFFFPWIPEGLKESTLVTLAAIVATFPITAFNFGEFSIVAFVANFLVLPVIELVMMFGVILVLLPNFLGFIFTLWASITWVPLDYFVKVVKLLGSLKFASVSIGDFPPWTVFTWYFLIFLMVICFYPDKTSNYLVKDLRL